MIRHLIRALLCCAPVGLAFELPPAPVSCRPVAGEDRAWDTRSFRIISEVEVSRPDLERLAVVADSTARAVGRHAVPWFDPPGGRRAVLRICRDGAGYEAAGGVAGMAGYYLWREGTVVLDAAQLFPPAAAGSRLRPLPDERLLVHEIVHLCMHGSQGRMPQWFSEGVCEYFTAAHQGGGKFDFRDMDRRIREYIRGRLGGAVEDVPALAVSALADLDHREWLRLILDLPAGERYRGYVTALLLVHYHLHAEARKREITDAFASSPPASPPAFRELRADAAAIERAMLAYWRPRGLKITFHDPEIGRQPLSETGE